MKKVFLALGLAACLLGGNQLFAQFTAEEQADYAKWEDFLATAKLVGRPEHLTGSQAVTEPWVLTLEKDGVRSRALWKNVLGEKIGGYKETWKGEIAAYRLNRLLGVNMVPPTVEREFQGDRGSCQLWVEAPYTMETIRAKKLNPPSLKTAAFYRALYMQRAFDNLISNEDRHQRNYIITDDWRMILIDHSRTFRTTKKFTTRLIYDEKFKEGPNFIMDSVPKAFYEALKALTPEAIGEAVGEYLTDQEIAATIARRDLMIAWLDKRIAALGETRVLY